MFRGTVMGQRILRNTFQGCQEQTPIWFMRQAGRHLPEFREIRSAKPDLMGLFLSPQDICEITLQPVRRYDIDGAIIFSDILMTPYALGMDLTFHPGSGPRMTPLPSDLKGWCRERLSHTPHDRLRPVYESLKSVRATLPQDKTLLGFAGAPWTLACYMVAGSSSKTHQRVKDVAYGDPEAFDCLISLLVDQVAAYLIAQVDAGADVLQIFDSWSGILPQPFFQRWCVAPTAEIVRRVKAVHPTTPLIGFPRGGQGFYETYVTQTQVDGLSLDGPIDDKAVAKALGQRVVLQGNLDPQLLCAGGPLLEVETLRILETYGGGRHIFNLSHGVLPETPVAHVERVIKTVRAFDARRREVA